MRYQKSGGLLELLTEARAPATLRSLLPEVDYFVEKFTFAIDKCGGYPGDLKNLQAQRKGLEDMAGVRDACAGRPPDLLVARHGGWTTLIVCAAPGAPLGFVTAGSPTLSSVFIGHAEG